LTADGSRLLAVNGNNGTMTVVDTATNAVVDTVSVGGYASDFVVATGGNRAYVLVNPPNDGFDLVTIDTVTNAVVERTPLGPDADLPTLSPDGGTLYLWDSIDRSIRVVDTSTLSVTDIAAEDNVTAVAASPDGGYLFVSTFPDLHVYDTRTHAMVRSFDHLGAARFLVFSPDGSILYTANLDGDTLAVIDTTTLAHTTVDVGPNPTNAAVSPDGLQLFLLNGDGTVSVLDTITKRVETVDIHGRPNDQYQIAMSPDGRHVYVPQYETGTLAVISARTVNLAPTVDVDQAEDPRSGAITYTATGVDADGDDLVYTAALLAPGALTKLGVQRFRFVPDRAGSGHLPPGIHDAVSITVSDGHGGSTSVRGTYAVPPSTEATVVARVTVGGEVRSVAVSPDGTTAYVPIIDHDGRSRVEVLDTTSGDLHAVVALADDPRGTATLNSDGSRLVVPGGEYVMVIDTTTFEVIAALEGADHAVLSADGLKAYTLRADEMSVYDVDPGSHGFGTRIATIATGGYAEGMTSGHDGRIYFATSDFTVTAIDTATDQVVATVRIPSGSHNVAAAPGRLYASLHGTSLAVIDTDAATVRANIPIRVQSPGPYVTANADGTRVYLSRREEGILSVFDPTTNAIIASVRVGDGTVHPAAVSADGSLVVVPVGDSITTVATGRTVEV
jgi:YVTN family beta-propeller protein